MTDPRNDDAEILEIMRRARAKSRGWASYWEWALDRQLAELHVARVMRNYLALTEPGLDAGPTLVTPDPPDTLIVTSDGRRLGIEVTELISARAVERYRYLARHGELHRFEWPVWTDAAIADAVAERIDAKDVCLAKAKEPYDELIVAITTDEPLTPDMVERALESCVPFVRVIDRAFVLMSYQPESDTARYPDSCPIFPVRLTRTP